LWKIRFSNVLSDAESLKLDSDGNIIDIGRKVKDSQEIQGQYIGLLKFSGQGRKDMINFYDRATENEKRQVPVEKFRKMFMTDFLQLLIDANIKIKAVPIKNGWLEIDTKSDYELYLKLYEDNKLSEFIKLG
jgi:choline kinase